MHDKWELWSHGLTIMLLVIGSIPWFFDMSINLSGYRYHLPLLAYGITITLSINTCAYFKRYHFNKYLMVLPWFDLILFMIPTTGLINDTLHTLGLLLISGWILLTIIIFDPTTLKILAIASSLAMASMMLTMNINYLSEFCILMAYELILVKPLFKATFHR